MYVCVYCMGVFYVQRVCVSGVLCLHVDGDLYVCIVVDAHMTWFV